MASTPKKSKTLGKLINILKKDICFKKLPIEEKAMRGLLLVASTFLFAASAVSVEGGSLNLTLPHAGDLVSDIELFFDASSSLRISSHVGDIWKKVRSNVIAPIIESMIIVCLVMSVMLVTEAVFMAATSIMVKLLRRKPEKRYKWEEIGVDEEAGSLAYPMVLIQIPMFNEKEVYKHSIGAACGLTWPSDRIIIQVLDDSTDPVVKDLVAQECRVWQSKGVKVAYEVRNNRKGYKAGALKKGMEHDYVQQCEFVAIFDADFQPDSDFLLKTIPFLVHNSRIALVQARWDFVNYKECLMTRIQKMSLDYHFKVEQEAGSSTYAFFGFNGTAGVWRISTISEVGGWKDRTTVEDMDLAVRASIQGWEFLYVGDIKVKSELPSTFQAYRHQQHRWTCGAANLFRKVVWETVMTKEASIWKKLHVIYSFFFVRKIISHIVTFTFYCIVIPISLMVPEVTLPLWGVMYIPTTITILNAVRNPRSIHIMPFWILFENVMSMHRMRATVIGLMETGNVNEWVVTEKLGDALKARPENGVPELTSIRPRKRVYFSELGFAVFLIFCASYDLAFKKDCFFIYIYLQAIAFIVVGLGFVGTSTCNS